MDVQQLDPFSTEYTTSRLSKALYILNDGLRPFIKQILKKVHGDKWVITAYEAAGLQANPSTSSIDNFDTRLLLMVLTKRWDDFHLHSNLEIMHRNLCHEVRQVRNSWAHQNEFTTEDLYRALDNIERILKAVNATKESNIVNEYKKDLILIMAQNIIQYRSIHGNPNDLQQVPDALYDHNEQEEMMMDDL